MNLPTTPRAATASAPSMLIVYGPPKVGKTSSVAQLPNTLILDCEQPSGTRFISCMSVPVTTFTEFINICNQIVKEGKKYTHIVVDSIDALERMAMAEANVRYKTSNVGRNFMGKNILTELEKGAGYPWLWDCVRDALDAVGKASNSIILIGHLKEKLLPDGMTSEDSDGADLDLTGKVRNIVCARADAIGLLKRKVRPGRKPGEPGIADLWLNFRTTDQTNCGIRIERLAGKEFIFASNDDRRARWEEIYPI